jgi:uncharacterized protein YbcI
MEKIGKHNYEAFLLDYIEGNLDETGRAALFAFLEQHPELKPDLEDFDIIPATIISEEPEQLSVKDKRSLKHIPEEIEEKIIAYLEGQLSPVEKAAFELELPRNAFMQQTLEAYRKTYLTAGDELFAAKMQLKRTTVAEETIIAYFEGQLSPAEKAAFEKVLATDEVVQYTLHAYKQSRLEADAAVVFPDKESLKREAKVVRLFTYQRVWAIAASVVLLFGIFWLLNLDPKQSSDAAGSLALKKGKLRLKNQTKTEGTQGSQMASNPGIYKMSNRPNTQQQNGTVQPENNTPQQQMANTNTTPNNLPPQQMANNNIPADTGKGKSLLHPNRPEVEPRSLIVINPYKVNDNDSVSSQPVARARFGSSEYVAQQINKAAWGEEEEETTKAVSPEEKKVKGFDVLALIGKGLRKLGNHRADAKKIEDKEKDYTEYVVTIGSLSVTRKVAN